VSIGGQDIELRHGGYTAAVTTVGGGLRALAFEGRDLVRAYPADAVRPKYAGALLVPWPNRVVDGRYEFHGSSYQLDLSEPARQHAIHGLVTWERFERIAGDGAGVVLRHELVPRTGYPFELSVEVVYRLDDGGLRTSVTSTNTGATPLPYGVGPHPYLVGGPGRVDAWAVHLPAEQVLEVTADRLVPVGLRPAAASGLDFSRARVVGTQHVDHAYTGLMPGDDGLVRARVTGPDGAGVECVWDPRVLPWAQLHTADVPGSPDLHRTGLAVEPMTCPPDAFNSGTDLVVLEPTTSHQAEWTIRAVPAQSATSTG
jgi:aldose 1-epimerase